MKNLSRILTIVLCCVPFAYAKAAGTVATTSGSNLTAFNPSYSNNNQWATLSNTRSDYGNNGAKADFKNCEAIVLRCAQPKCGNGGCSDMTVAGAIVNGCVQSNENCKQYGNDLINSLSGQLVANSTAKVNAQNAAIAQQQQYEQQQQMQQMQAQMQQQMMQMQQQNNETVQQLQSALAQQQAQNQQAIENMRVAATEAAKKTEAGVSVYQQEAISRGVSTDVLERQKITGQIMTEIEDAEVSLKKVKEAMMSSFEYAGCDSRGDNCVGPKRVKKWRELAKGFIDPYDDVIDNIYDALSVSQLVGVDLSEIYMMLNDSCNSWGQYMCEPGYIDYNHVVNGVKTNKPYSCPTANCATGCAWKYPDVTSAAYKNCASACGNSNCKPCTLLKVLSDKEQVYEGWVNTEDLTEGNNTVIACASNALETGILARRAKRTKNASVIDLDYLERWINQAEPNVKQDTSKNIEYKNYCDGYTNREALQTHALSRTIPVKGAESLCVKKADGNQNAADEDDNCPYIRNIYGICDTHVYNIGKTSNDISYADREEMQEVIGLKTTVISQQMFKQYEYLEATLRRLKTQLEKAVLTTALEAAGGESSSSSSGGLVGASSRDSDKTIHIAGAQNCSNLMDFDAAYNCIQSNVSLILSNVNSNTKNACLQLQSTYSSATTVGIKEIDNCMGIKTDKNNSCSIKKKDDITKCAQSINYAVMKAKEDRNNKSSGFVVVQQSK